VWRLSEPASLADPATLGQTQDDVRSIHRAIIDTAKRHGWKVDNTSDLSRVYRMPGTTNRKPGMAAPAVARWYPGEGATGARFTLADVRPRSATPMSSENEDRPPAGWPIVADGGRSFGGGISSLFAPPEQRHAAGEVRAFTVDQALAFVAPKLEALRAACDGEINVRLNEAACALAHFGGEFWDAGAADGQLMRALESTAYDGATWQAEDTIASARRAMAGEGQWRATLVPVTAEQAVAAAEVAGEADPVAALLAEMLTFEQVSSIPPPRYLIHGLLQFDSESWVIGAPGSKKSFVVLDMAARIARGDGTWQGRRVNPADVVMIVAEGAGGSGKRVAAWRKRYGEVAGDGIRILPRPVQSTVRVGGERVINPAWHVLAAACGRLADAARVKGRGMLVVIDTQARVTVGMNENSAEDVGFYIEAVRLVRERAGGACVLTVHHTGRTGGDARGSSAIDGAQTTELSVQSKPGSLTARVTVDKQKDIEQIESIDLAFEVIDLGRDVDGEPVDSIVLAEPGSAAFLAAWSEGVADGQEKGGDGVTPFKDREALDGWIVSEVDSRAHVQHWIVQALVDTAETLGLTQSEVRGLVEERRGKLENSSWRKAWQKVTDEAGSWHHVVRPANGQRWTVDRMGVAAVLRILDS
jgi:hypothetical protein